MTKLAGLPNMETGELFVIMCTAVSKVYSRMEEKTAIDKKTQKRKTV